MLMMDQLSLSIEGKLVIQNLSATLRPGTITACMGSNGSGKSSLANGLAGHPFYEVKHGTISLLGEDITAFSPDARARAGLFLSQQYPQALPGVTVSSFLKESFRALYPKVDLQVFEERLQHALELLQFDRLFLSRSINDGFSGGEKKRCEVLQLLVLSPKVALLDEIDSGLDVDALKSIGRALAWFVKHFPETSLLVITHYQKIFDYLTPDQVLVLSAGKLVKTGDTSLICQIEEKGYEQFREA